MSRQRGIRSAVAAASLLASMLGATAFAADEPVNIVKYRKAFMDVNGAHITMIAAVVKGEVSFGDVAGSAQALAEQGKLLTANLKQLFPEGTAKGETAEKSGALPVIWEKWAEFEQAAQKFEEESAKFAEVAQGGDMAAIGPALGAFGKQGCGTCHETFREKAELDRASAWPPRSDAARRCATTGGLPQVVPVWPAERSGGGSAPSWRTPRRRLSLEPALRLYGRDPAWRFERAAPSGPSGRTARGLSTSCSTTWSG